MIGILAQIKKFGWVIITSHVIKLWGRSRYLKKSEKKKEEEKNAREREERKKKKGEKKKRSVSESTNTMASSSATTKSKDAFARNEDGTAVDPVAFQKAIRDDPVRLEEASKDPEVRAVQKRSFKKSPSLSLSLSFRVCLPLFEESRSVLKDNDAA